MTRPATSPQRPQKAGLFLHGFATGDFEKRHRLVIAPYSEGRFGQDDKFYVLPKGSIDGGEHAVVAALREAAEETGIDLRPFLGPENIARLERGEVLTNLTHPDFPGVVLRKFDPHPVNHTYYWSGYRANDLQLFGVEIAGIERLQPHCKNQENGNGIGRVGKRVSDRTRDRQSYPGFREMIGWMEQGAMPRAAWNAQREHLPQLPAVHGQPFGEWFRGLERRMKLPEHPTTSQWQRFSARVQRANGEDEKHFRDALKTIKQQLVEVGVLQGDLGEIKLDEKDSPFAYYQEGADLLPFDQYLAFCIERMRGNRQYAEAFGGADMAKTGGHLRPRDYFHRSQLVACAPFMEKAPGSAEPDYLALAEQQLEARMAFERPKWDRPRHFAPKLELRPQVEQKQQDHAADKTHWLARLKIQEELRALRGEAAPALS